jgi:hypothetical protein
LKNDAYQAEVEEELELAEQLWIRVLAAASGNDMQAIRSLQRIERLRVGRSELKTDLTPQPPSLRGKGEKSSPLLAGEGLGERSTSEIANSQTDDLSSDKGVDYTKLRDLLAQGKWREADEETLLVMLKVAGREEEGWLGVKDIEKFPCTDLRTIDTLWVKYSKGRFGFSVQKRIWESVGGTPNADYETYCHFGDRVKWRVDKNWLNYSDLTFTTDTTEAQEGHLPFWRAFAFAIVVAVGSSGRWRGRWWRGVVLFSRVETCKL